MWNQPDEYFIEVVSNASMDDFPDNTLSKFTNKLPIPLQLDGEWVVGIQEIFYPIDLAPEEKKIKVQLFTTDEKEKLVTDVTLNENDPSSMIISKINDALKNLFATVVDKDIDKTTKSKRSLTEKVTKPDIIESSQTLRALSIDEVSAITPEKIRELSATERNNLYNSIKEGVPIILNTLYKEMERYRDKVVSKDKRIELLNTEIKTFSSMLDETRAAKNEEHMNSNEKV